MEQIVKIKSEFQKRFDTDLKKAMLGKDNPRRDFIRIIIGEINRFDVITDDVIYGILKRLKNDAILMNNPHEVVIIEEYLPKPITKEELTEFIKKVIVDNSLVDMKGMGKVISELKTKYGTNYDGKLASDIYKENI